MLASATEVGILARSQLEAALPGEVKKGGRRKRVQGD